MDKPKKVVDTIAGLREFTAARIALGRSGDSIPLNQSLQFKLAHAHARDAVHSMMDIAALTTQLAAFKLPLMHVHSKAHDRLQYLKRPDLGRQLSEASEQLFECSSVACDISIIIADGLSALAVNSYAPALLEILLPMLNAMKYRLAPLCLAEQARVALADEVAAGLNASLSIILIGERPGLSAADSMSAYITYSPKPGLTDESRNCVSNIRPDGLSFKLAAAKIFYLVQESFSRKLSGVQLKDNAGLLGE